MLSRGNLLRPVEISYTDHIRPRRPGIKKRMQAIPTRKKLIFNNCLKIVLKDVVICRKRIMVKMNTNTVKRRT
jgi:hypothetical protein